MCEPLSDTEVLATEEAFNVSFGKDMLSPTKAGRVAELIKLIIVSSEPDVRKYVSEWLVDEAKHATCETCRGNGYWVDHEGRLSKCPDCYGFGRKEIA